MSDRGCGEMIRKKMQQQADQINEGFAKAKAKNGWKLVPVEPTKEMRLAGGETNSPTISLTSAGDYAVEVYKAMLAAAPTNPQPVSSRLVDELRAMVEKWRGAKDLIPTGYYNMVISQPAMSTDQCADELEALIERLTSNIPDTTALKGQ